MSYAFDNRKHAIFYRVSSFSFSIVAIIILSAVYFSNLISDEARLFSKLNITLAVVGLYLLIGLYRYWLDLYYFYFSNQGQVLTIRYYSLRPFSHLKRSIQIPKESFAGYKITYDWSGLKPSLILTQKTFEGEKSYPEISISSLRKQEINKLKKGLEQFRPK